MGASTAYHLSRLGITDVVVVEREPLLGTGSTGRNAGGVRHQFSQEANVRLSIESIRLFERFEEEVGTPIDFHQDGYLFLLGDDATVARFERHAAMQRRLGVDVRMLGPDEAARLAPGLAVEGVAGASFCARDGIADPNGVTQGFARAASAAGATILRETEVTGVSTRSGRVTGVATSRGDIAAPIVVNAAGPWSAAVGRMAGLAVPVAPARRHIFVATPPVTRPGNPPPLPPTRIMVIDFETTFYFHREGDNVLFGMGDPSEAPTFDTTVQWDFLDRVIPVAVGRLPALADSAISHAWAGLYEMTPDAMPVIGPAPGLDGFLLITGFSGHGFQHAPAAGRILADVIAGRDPRVDLTPFSLGRFGEDRAAAEATVV